MWILFPDKDIRNECNDIGLDASKQIKIEYNAAEEASLDNDDTVQRKRVFMDHSRVSLQRFMIYIYTIRYTRPSTIRIVRVETIYMDYSPFTKINLKYVNKIFSLKNLYYNILKF